MRALILLVFLAGCAGMTKPEVVHDVVYVNVPVPVPCVKREQLPAPVPDTKMKNGAAVNKNAAAVGLDVTALQEYHDSAKVLLDSCVEDQP